MVSFRKQNQSEAISGRMSQRKLGATGDGKTGYLDNRIHHIVLEVIN